MQLRSKYYTYPVIIEGGDFYSDSSFETDAEKEMVGYDIKFILTAKLVNPQLEDMLKSNKVSIIHHIECPQTCLRTKNRCKTARPKRGGGARSTHSQIGSKTDIRQTQLRGTSAWRYRTSYRSRKRHQR